MAISKSQSNRRRSVSGSITEKKHNEKSIKNINLKKKGKVKIFLIVILGIFFGGCHSVYISTLFENSRHFSHLSGVEREMSFRTEMGLYYSYYKTIVESSSFMSGLYSITHDNLTEYPDRINTLQRFNVYPEVFMSAAFRIYTSVTKYFKIPTKECWFINRGEKMPPVESCEGLGDPAYFYINCVWLMGGITIAVLFYYSVYLSKSVLGGILAVLCFFYNHGECTRVQWTPPLRESFGYPIVLTQMFAVTHALQHRDEQHFKFLSISCLTSLFIICWQFAPFVLTTQLLAVFSLYVLRFLSNKTITLYLYAVTVGYACSICVLFFNPMLMTSLLTVLIPASFIVVKLEKIIYRMKHRVCVTIVQGSLFMAIAFVIKKLTFSQEHDSHVWNILRAKFTNYSDFHTSLYVCAVEFDFIEIETIWKLTESFLLPTAIIVLIVVIGQIWHRENWKNRNLKSKCTEKFPLEDCEIIYNALQLCAFSVMAIIIMRLKLFFTPHLCIASSLLASKKFFQLKYKNLHYAVVVVVIALMSVQGISNIKSDLSIIGEYNNPSMEELFYWIKTKTSTSDCFAGPMPTMANIMLSTRRPIANHPHYEDASLRERTKKVYTLFSRKPPNEVFLTLKAMKIDYAILEEQWCYRGSRKGCSMLEVWDREDKENRNGVSVCDQIQQNSSPFVIVFQNHVYAVVKLP